jgi:hypothetical protein
VVTNLNDHSAVPVVDISRWFGKHVSSYIHMEIPTGSPASDYGSAPYATATSVGVRFQL